MSHLNCADSKLTEGPHEWITNYLYGSTIGVDLWIYLSSNSICIWTAVDKDDRHVIKIGCEGSRPVVYSDCKSVSGVLVLFLLITNRLRSNEKIEMINY